MAEASGSSRLRTGTGSSGHNVPYSRCSHAAHGLLALTSPRGSLSSARFECSGAHTCVWCTVCRVSALSEV